jgi:hypothetical protein
MGVQLYPNEGTAPKFFPFIVMNFSDCSTLDLKCEQWNTTCEAVEENSVSSSQALFFMYGKVSDMQRALREGLPAAATHGGVVVTLSRPHDLTLREEIIFGGAEACIAVALPKRAVAPLPDQESAGLLWIVRCALLESLRNVDDNLDDIPQPERWKQGYLFLPPQKILRAYLLKDVEVRDSVRATLNPMQTVEVMSPVRAPQFRSSELFSALPKRAELLESCGHFLSTMARVRTSLRDDGLVPIYHFTTTTAASLILNSGFRMSTQGKSQILKYIFPIR